MKKILKRILIPLAAFALLLSFVPAASAASVTASPTRQTVQLRTMKLSMQGYNIGGSNYFKLRDLAAALSGSVRCFSISWDGGSNTIALASKENYIPVGGEMAGGAGSAGAAAESTAKVTLNGRTIDLTGYNIGGNNYYKLRDVASYINFSVNYDEASDTVTLDPTYTYFLDALMELLKGPTDYTVVRNYALNTVTYNGLDAGLMTIMELGDSKYNISATNISTAHDEAAFKSVLALYFSNPDAVINALKLSETQGKKTLTLDGRDVTCAVIRQEWSVNVTW